MDNQTNLPGKIAAERIEKALRSLDFNSQQIAQSLFSLDQAVQEEVGQELINTLPEEKKKEFLKLVEEKKPLSELKSYLPALTQEEIFKKIEDKLNKVADVLERWTASLENANKEAKEQIIQRILNSLSNKQNPLTATPPPPQP